MTNKIFSIVLRVEILLYVLVEYIRHWIDMIVIKNFNIDLTELFLFDNI